jgi:thiol-disulfide isomerase/thioredoxin
MTRTLILLLVCSLAATADLVRDVRSLIAQGDFAGGERAVNEFRKANGATPEMILGLSWLGRGAQAAKKWDDAERYASETRKLCLEALTKRKLDDEPNLPLALGASIEVHGHTLAGRNARSEAVAFLQQELKTWHATSIRTRIQKNLHLLSLEGKPTPKLELGEHIGTAKPVPIPSLKGKPVVLFFWAHWCGDCKQQGPVLERLQQEYGPKGLVVVGPTQRYGYVARGADAPPAEEAAYIERIRKEFYGNLAMAVPVSEENFKSFGASTTPTVVVVNRKGVVALYHPGKMTYDELKPVIERAAAD